LSTRRDSLPTGAVHLVDFSVRFAHEKYSQGFRIPHACAPRMQVSANENSRFRGFSLAGRVGLEPQDTKPPLRTLAKFENRQTMEAGHSLNYLE
jgi:hypothetical protein